MRAPTGSAVVARPRVLIGLLLLLVAALLPLTAMPALAQPPREVTIADTADVLNDEPLADRLRGVEFREPVHLAAVTLDVTQLGQSPTSDIALNDAILELARRDHPEWLSEDGMTWADGMVLIVIDPLNRKLGTYAGEDVKLSDGAYQSIQDAMRDHARSGAWDDAMMDGAQEYASLLGRPWYLSPGLILATAIGVLSAGIAALAIVAGFLWRRRTSRRLVERARERYADVMLHYSETELAARTIPVDSPYGEPVLRDYAEFQKVAAAATRLHEQLPQRPSFAWGATPASVKLAREYAGAVEKIDAMDDEIVATNDLLSRSNAWQDAWEREMAPLRDSLAQVDQAVRAEPALAGSPTATALRRTAAQVQDGLASTTTALQQRRMDPGEALSALDRMTADLARASTEHRDAIIGARARNREEERLMRRTDVDDTVDAYGTIRGRRRAHYPRSYPDYYSISPLVYLMSWNTSATHDLDTYRNPPDTSSHSGYSSSSSGGFSGSGSSSSF